MSGHHDRKRKRQDGDTHTKHKRPQLTAHNLEHIPQDSSEWLEERFGMPSPSSHSRKHGSSKSRSRNSSSQATSITRTSGKSGCYNPATDQAMEAAGILTLFDSRRPENLTEIRQRLEQDRASLSPPMSDEEYWKFQKTIHATPNEATLLQRLQPRFHKSDISGIGTTTLNASFVDSERWGEHISVQRPDISDGLQMADVPLELREQLRGKILVAPSVHSAVNNFCVEVKGPGGTQAVVERQSRLYGATGQRAINAMRSYGRPREVDSIARSFTVALNTQDVNVYATHTDTAMGKALYHTNLVASANYMQSPESFTRAKKLWRNSSQLAHEQRRQALTLAKAQCAVSKRRSPYEDSVDDEHTGEDSTSEGDAADHDSGSEGGEAEGHEDNDGERNDDQAGQDE